jgi:hypothetical protein
VSVHHDVVQSAPVSKNTDPASRVAGDDQFRESVDPSRKFTLVLAKVKEKYTQKTPILRLIGAKILRKEYFIVGGD